MPTLIKRLFHRPAIRFGMASDSRGKFRDPRFVSFISESNRKTLNTDFRTRSSGAASSSGTR